MRRTLLFLGCLLAAFALALPAQEVANDASPLYNPPTIQLHTLAVPPITGVPFSATAVIENKRTMPDGTVAETHNINLIGRDSRGRTHGEMRSGVPSDSKAEPQLNSVSIYDPQTEIRTTYTIATHVATLQHQSPPRETPAVNMPPNPLVKVEDLGTSVIDNVDVRGTRRSVTIPLGATGSSGSFTVVDEYWYSEDLHENLLLIHNDPRTGLQTVRLTDIKREDPDPSFFEVPEGYKIVDMTPPEGAPVLQRGMR